MAEMIIPPPCELVFCFPFCLSGRFFDEVIDLTEHLPSDSFLFIPPKDIQMNSDEFISGLPLNRFFEECDVLIP